MRQLICITVTLALWGCSDPGAEDVSAPAASDASAAPAPAAQGTAEVASPPDWLPAALKLPEDAEIVEDRRIGRSTRLLQARTAAAADALFDEYLAGLAGSGYETHTAGDRILFQGKGIEQGSVVFANTLDRGRVLQVDITMEKL